MARKKYHRLEDLERNSQKPCVTSEEKRALILAGESVPFGYKCSKERKELARNLVGKETTENEEDNDLDRQI